MKLHKKISQLLAGLAAILLFSAILVGCGGQQPAIEAAVDTPTLAASPTPLPSSTLTSIPTKTPQPTLTLTPTLTRTATPDLKGTLVANQTATRTAIEDRVNADLVKYEIDPALGHLSWIMKSAYTLDGKGYALTWYKPIADLDVVKDFVLQSDVTWDTSGGLSGCGFILRGRADMDLDIGDFYEFYMIRLQYSPRWFIDYVEDGRWMYSLPGMDGVVSSNILDDKMSKNTLTIDARGNRFTVYINGVKERVIENNKISEGRIALVAVQESGTSYCNFQNGWVWEYD